MRPAEGEPRTREYECGGSGGVVGEEAGGEEGGEEQGCGAGWCRVVGAEKKVERGEHAGGGGQLGPGEGGILNEERVDGEEDGEEGDAAERRG